MEQFREQFKPQAQPRVMSQLVIDKIIRTEGIGATDAEIDAKIEEQGKSVGKSFEEYKKSMDPRQADYIKNDIIVTKLFDFLMSNNELYTEGGEAEKTTEKPAAKSAKKTTKKKA